ncbi:hypothetical protein BC939DRAFT_465714 [Gamsiella multidivaricata]|uniref:uncharacterized protein n=1 Tax=Gamsiella multidivaricata TaxID=101098 RepID=UPI00221F098A|nr:uncharacterized protein BC939DRAFT_465714 [Gamsiella multidivaricata]KAI7817552.1 hypothetical protein BC939DRAFT_465714 [Gamsiella multidivaricata]
MQRSRSLVGIFARGTTTVSARMGVSRLALVVPSASLHTARTLAEEKRGFLSRLNPFAKPGSETPAQPSTAAATDVAQDLNVEIEEEEEEEIPSWKSERQSLTPEQLEASIRSAAAPFVDTASTLYLNKIRLDDPMTKFQVLKACVVSTGQEIPSKDLASIHTLKDIMSTLQRLDEEANALPENPNGHVVAEWFEKNKSSLPPNMIFIPYQKSKGIKAEDRKTTNKRFL